MVRRVISVGTSRPVAGDDAVVRAVGRTASGMSRPSWSNAYVPSSPASAAGALRTSSAASRHSHTTTPAGSAVPGVRCDDRRRTSARGAAWESGVPSAWSASWSARSASGRRPTSGSCTDWVVISSPSSSTARAGHPVASAASCARTATEPLRRRSAIALAT
jgi:hypothetical protein